MTNFTPTEIEQMTQSLKWLRYFPVEVNGEIDTLRCCLHLPDPKTAEALKKELRNLFKTLFPSISASVAALNGDPVIDLAIRNGDYYGNLTEKHFALGPAVEIELEKWCAARDITLSLPEDLEFSSQ